MKAPKLDMIALAHQAAGIRPVMEPEDEMPRLREIIGQLREILQCLKRGETAWPTAKLETLLFTLDRERHEGSER